MIQNLSNEFITSTFPLNVLVSENAWEKKLSNKTFLKKLGLPQLCKSKLLSIHFNFSYNNAHQSELPVKIR